MSDTPRTDAVVLAHGEECSLPCPCASIIGHARQLERELAAKQAEIDRLMLEYCPDEMTKEQYEKWANHQFAVKHEERQRGTAMKWFKGECWDGVHCEDIIGCAQGQPCLRRGR